MKINFRQKAALILIFSLSLAKGVMREFFTFLGDMTWLNFVEFYSSMIYIYAEPYLAAAIAPESYKIYMTY